MVVVWVLSVACGSTVAVGEQGAPKADAGTSGQAGEAQDQGLSLDTAQTGGTTEGVPGTTDEATTTETFGDTSITTSTNSGTTTSTRPDDGSTPSTPPPSSRQEPTDTTTTATYGPGVTDDEIVIGIAIPDEASKAQNENLLGVEGVTQGDIERYYDIMADYINERGGIADRTLRYSKWRFSTADGENASQLEQSACAHWTQDDPALAAPAITESDNFLGCAHDAGMGTWTSSLTTADDRKLETFPTHLMFSSMSLTRQGPILAEGLETQGYFDEGYKLGVVTYDGPTWRRAVNGSLEPALNGLGRRIDEKAFLKKPESNSQLGDLTAQIQSTVLRFKTEGVTHVTFLDERGVITLLFTRSAENQDYRPRYGLTSQAGNTVIAGSVPEGQFDRALGVGWMPALDVPPGEAPENPAVEECLARFAEKGEEPANQNNKGVMLIVCETVFFVKRAVEAGLPDIAALSYQRGAESLGAFESLTSFANYLSPERHDGASHYRTVAYDPDCNCFHYTSDLIADLP